MANRSTIRRRHQPAGGSKRCDRRSPPRWMWPPARFSPTATTKPSPAEHRPLAASFYQTWAEHGGRAGKAAYTDTGIEVAAHTGTKEFDAYVDGSEGQALMHDLTTVAFKWSPTLTRGSLGSDLHRAYACRHDELFLLSILLPRKIPGGSK